MKKLLFISLMAITMVASAFAQDDEAVITKKAYIMPGKGHINVENLIKPINTKMDISQLNVSELRVLRNAFAARQGYIFMDGEMRSIFQTTTWYDSLMWQRFEKEEEMKPQKGDSYTIPLKYSAKEQEFIKKLKDREKELLADNGNFKSKNEGWRVNADNIVNPYQLEKIDERLMTALGKNGFAIVPDNKLQLFHIYENNDYHDFPSFVTTDMYLQLFHMFFDQGLKSIEEEKFNGAMVDLCTKLYEKMGKEITDARTKEMKDAAEFGQAFAAIGLALANGEPLKPVADKYKEMAEGEVKSANSAENEYSPFLEYTKVKFAYSLFRPRGHYTRNDLVKRYFRAMMWLQTAPMHADTPHQLCRAALMASVVGSNPDLLKSYNRIFEPITFLMGAPDNITILQVYQEVLNTGLPCDKLFANKKAMKKLENRIKELANEQIRIRPKFDSTSPYKINLMPQRYQPDAEVLNEMVDADSEVSKRATPMGLDVMAAMGNSKAEKILLEELQQGKQWEDYTPMLTKMKNRMDEINWKETVATRWMETLQTMTQTKDSYPYFMQTEQWQKKDLNTALASWAELKHDAILYAKQPMAAECGDYGPPAPVIKGYVEPNIGFWEKAIELMDATMSLLRKYDLVTEKIDDTNERIKEQAEFFLLVSKAELNGKKLSDVDYYTLETIGATFENISLDLVRQKDQYLDGWNNVEGADKSIAVVADVYTANGENNPEPSILYEGTGPAYEIYVLVEINGYLYLTRGGVFSYREFRRPVDEPRMTDEEWQEKLKQYPNTGIPSWMDEITVPLEQAPTDNEQVFYSSGC